MQKDFSAVLLQVGAELDVEDDGPSRQGRLGLNFGEKFRIVAMTSTGRATSPQRVSKHAEMTPS